MRRIAALSLLCAVGLSAHAADPRTYTVILDKTGDAALDQALNDSSMLIGLREQVPVGPFALLVRAQEDQGRFETALRSFGYYKGKAAMSIAGHALDDPALAEFLEKSPTEPAIPVQVHIERGPLFHLGKIDIQGMAPQAIRPDIGIAGGDPALAPQVLAAQEKLLETLRGQGHALAKVEPPIATLHEDNDTLDVDFQADPGPRLDLGAIEVKGLEHLNEAFVRQRLLVQPGERYDPAALDKARRDLVSLGVFSSVRVVDADKPDEHGRLPIAFDIQERPRHAANLNAAYSTDIGGSFAVLWQHRNLLGNAEQLNLSVGMTQLGGNSTTGIGYNALASFIKPDFWLRDQSIQANLGALKQNLTAYDREAITGELLLNRKLAEHWSASLGFAGEQERITQEGETRDYTLLSLPGTLKYDDTNNLLDPTEGMRGAVLATPTQPLAGPQTDTFLSLQVSGSTYFDLGEPGRSVLALRGLIGDVLGASAGALPPDKRFYAGGSATVRGYKFLSIGPQFPDHKPRGGSAVVAGTVEFRQRFLDSYGAVVFVDAGQVAENSAPFTGTAGMGVGLGARYYTSIGPIRVDVAVPVVHVPNSGNFEVYIGLGQAF